MIGRKSKQMLQPKFCRPATPDNLGHLNIKSSVIHHKYLAVNILFFISLQPCPLVSLEPSNLTSVWCCQVSSLVGSAATHEGARFSTAEELFVRVRIKLIPSRPPVPVHLVSMAMLRTMSRDWYITRRQLLWRQIKSILTGWYLRDFW